MEAWGTRLPGEMMSPMGTTEPRALQRSERRLGGKSCWGPPWGLLGVPGLLAHLLGQEGRGCCPGLQTNADGSCSA